MISWNPLGRDPSHMPLAGKRQGCVVGVDEAVSRCIPKAVTECSYLRAPKSSIRFSLSCLRWECLENWGILFGVPRITGSTTVHKPEVPFIPNT